MIDYDRIAQAYEYEARTQYCFIEDCVQTARHIVGDNPLCCYHYSEETGEDCGCDDIAAADYEDAMNESAQGTYNGKTPADFATDYPRCLGVGKRFCDATPTEGTPYCGECHQALDALHYRAAGQTPLHDADASAITETTLMNGNILIRHNRMTIFCGSASVLADLRAYLAWPLIETAAERADDAIEALAELRAA